MGVRSLVSSPVRKAVLAAALVVAAGIFLFVRASAGGPLADPACPAGAPAMAFNVSGALRQDDIAVTDGEGGIRRLTDDHASWDPSFSPDGSKIVFTTGRHGTHLECCGFDRQDVYVMSSDGTDQYPLMELSPSTFHYEGRSTGAEPAWSPDGRWIALVRGDGLFLVHSEGGEPRLLYESKRAAVHSPAWSRDSERIAFRHSARGGNESIFVVEVDTKQVDAFARDVGVQGDIAWSPDGDSVAFERYPRIFVVSAGGVQRRLLVKGGQAPAWSPDGSELAYLADVGSDRRMFTQPVPSGERSRVDTGDMDLYSFETDLDWLDCPG
ncbi:MAG: hypothetical protein M3279_01585 [Actinomycetota bacterium]|nr:hypothetical protein [Actinomycetota bacterium]